MLVSDGVKYLLAMSSGHWKVSSHATLIPDGLGGEGSVIDLTYSDEAIPKRGEY